MGVGGRWRVHQTFQMSHPSAPVSKEADNAGMLFVVSSLHSPCVSLYTGRAPVGWTPLCCFMKIAHRSTLMVLPSSAITAAELVPEFLCEMRQETALLRCHGVSSLLRPMASPVVHLQSWFAPVLPCS